MGNTITLKAREELTSNLMRLWAVSATKYRLLPIKYKFLHGIRAYAKAYVTGYGGLNVSGITDKELAEYPEIPFLRIVDQVSAREFLEDLGFYQLMTLRNQVEDFESLNYVKNTLEGKIADYEYWWKNINTVRSSAYMDPDARVGRKGGRHTSYYGLNGADRHFL